MPVVAVKVCMCHTHTHTNFFSPGCPGASMMSASGRGVQKAMLSVAIKIMNPRPILSAGNVQLCHVWGHPLTVQALLLLLLFILLWLCWLPVALQG